MCTSSGKRLHSQPSGTRSYKWFQGCGTPHYHVLKRTTRGLFRGAFLQLWWSEDVVNRFTWNLSDVSHTNPWILGLTMRTNQAKPSQANKQTNKERNKETQKQRNNKETKKERKKERNKQTTGHGKNQFKQCASNDEIETSAWIWTSCFPSKYPRCTLLDMQSHKKPPWHRTQLSSPAKHDIVHHPWPPHLADGPRTAWKKRCWKGTTSLHWLNHNRITLLAVRGIETRWTLKDRAISPLPGRHYNVMFPALPSTAHVTFSANGQKPQDFRRLEPPTSVLWNVPGMQWSQGRDRCCCLWLDGCLKIR